MKAIIAFILALTCKKSSLVYSCSDKKYVGKYRDGYLSNITGEVIPYEEAKLKSIWQLCCEAVKYAQLEKEERI